MSAARTSRIYAKSAARSCYRPGMKRYVAFATVELGDLLVTAEKTGIFQAHAVTARAAALTTTLVQP